MEFKILLVEDEKKIADSLKLFLISKGYEVDIAYDGLMAEKLFTENNYSLCLFDINIPYKSGLELCKELRMMKSDIPIIIITAFGELDDKLVAFGFGADDYIVKPFHFDELYARIKVFLKRTDVNTLFDEIIKIGDLTINLNDKSVTRGETKISLSTKEYKLLELLAKANGKPIHKKIISEKVWDINFDTGTNTIEVYINFLRNKIDKNFDSKLIHTKPGFGYFLKVEDE